MTVAVATIADLVWREPPTRVHPVVGMGGLLTLAERHVVAQPRARSRRDGLVAVATVTAVVGGAACAVQAALARLRPPWLRVVVEGGLLWTLVSLRLLVDHVRQVGDALDRGDLDEGRRRTAMIVSRDTSGLDATACREAAIESLAENLNDAWVSTLLWYAVAGLPGAAVHRLVDTADSRWGYRDRRWRWAGTAAARLDDLLAAPGARLTGLALLPPARWRELHAQAGRTPSPNAGWPMAAMALRLDVRLGKPGVYELNADGRLAGPSDVPDAVRAALPVAVAVAVAVALVRGCRG